jgi:hypothetical protein
LIIFITEHKQTKTQGVPICDRISPQHGNITR